MIKIRGASLSFGGETIFEDVDFTLNSSEKIGLIGRNGSGKSSFIKMILGRIVPDDGKVDVPNYYSIACLEQHLQFNYDSIIEEVVSVLDDERQYEQWKGEKILSGLGFSDEEMLENPNQFSGGYQIKINLAKLLLLEPNLLLLDEPTNYLDIHSTRWLKKFLKEWPNELILITHDRAFMDSIITHTLNIHRGRFRKIPGTTQKINEQIAMEEEIHEKTRVNQDQKRKKTQAWIDRFKSKASMASRAQSKIKSLEKQEVYEKLDEIATLSFSFNYLPTHTKDYLLTAKSLSFGYDIQTPLIKGLSFRVEKGDKVCVIGKNGKGKSTLLKLLAKEMQPQSGSISWHNKLVCGYFGQMNIDRLDPSSTICDEIQSADSTARYEEVRKTCSKMMFTNNAAKKKISVLSGGEKSRVMLGKILLTPVNFLLLDEPTNHLDIESAEALMHAISTFQGVVVMVTHDECYLKTVANKLIIYDDGKVFFFNGGYSQFLKQVGWNDV